MFVRYEQTAEVVFYHEAARAQAHDLALENQAEPVKLGEQMLAAAEEGCDARSSPISSAPAECIVLSLR